MYGYVMEGGRASLTMRQIGGVWFAVAVLPRSGFLAAYRRGRLLRRLRRQGIVRCVLPFSLTAEAERYGLHGVAVEGLRLALLVAGCVILAFGMTIVIRSQAGTGPNDLVAVVLSDKLRKPFGPVRIGVDLTFALVGLALGGVVGLGTVICAFLVGPAAQLFFPISQRLCEAALAQFAGVRSQT